MRVMSSRILLNLGLIVVVAVAGLLLYSLVTRVAAPRVDPVRESNPSGLAGGVIQVEILNGCGIDNLAAETRNYVHDRGFDVVNVGNYERSDVDSSLVIDRVGDMESARKVANLLGVGEGRVIQEIDPERYLDVTIVLGNDYRDLRPFRDRSE